MDKDAMNLPSAPWRMIEGRLKAARTLALGHLQRLKCCASVERDYQVHAFERRVPAMLYVAILHMDDRKMRECLEFPTLRFPISEGSFAAYAEIYNIDVEEWTNKKAAQILIFQCAKRLATDRAYYLEVHAQTERYISDVTYDLSSE